MLDYFSPDDIIGYIGVFINGTIYTSYDKEIKIKEFKLQNN